LGFIVSFAACVEKLQSAERPELTRLFPSGGQAGTTVEVEATGKFPVWPISAWSDSESIQWSVEEKSGKLKANINAAAKPGLHWLRLYHPSGATAIRPFLVSDVIEQSESEPNNRLAEANAIAKLPSCFHGVLGKRGDVDLVTLTLTAGQRLVATVVAAKKLQSPLDANVQLLDKEGFVLAENLDRFGLDPGLEFIAPLESTYYIRVFGFPATPDSTIAFGGGTDWIYRLRLQVGDSPLFGTDEENPLIDGRTANVIEEGHAATSDTALAVQIPSWTRGRIFKPGLQNFVRFRVSAGLQYRLQVVAREAGSELDPTLSILDSAGKQLSQLDDVENDRDPVLDWKAPADGEYIAVVKDFHLRGGPNFDFDLMVTVLSPDFKASIISDLIQCTVGKEIELQVKVDRELDFAGEIDIGLENPLDGVECAIVKSVHGGETAKKITLRIKSSVAYQGPIAIIAKATDGTMIRFASSEAGKPIWLSCVAE